MEYVERDKRREGMSIQDQFGLYNALGGNNQIKTLHMDCYLISTKWMKKFRNYINYSVLKKNLNARVKNRKNPLAINNKNLFKKNTINPKLKEGKDYEIVNKETWNLLTSIYGGGPKIERITFSKNNNWCIDLVIPKYKVSLENKSNSCLIQIPSTNTILELKERSVAQLGLKNSSGSYNLWTGHNEEKVIEIKNMNQKIYSLESGSELPTFVLCYTKKKKKQAEINNYNHNFSSPYENKTSTQDYSFKNDFVFVSNDPNNLYENITGMSTYTQDNSMFNQNYSFDNQNDPNPNKNQTNSSNLKPNTNQIDTSLSTTTNTTNNHNDFNSYSVNDNYGINSTSILWENDNNLTSTNIDNYSSYGINTEMKDLGVKPTSDILKDSIPETLDVSQDSGGIFVKKSYLGTNSMEMNNYPRETLQAKPLDPNVRGLVGLNNLGNTCYFNSGLQCLLNTKPIVAYFLSKKYKKEINTKNPIGTGGKLVNEFANIMSQYWNEKSNTLNPKKLKNIIGNIAPQFSGNSQEDSQELLNFIIDGLHEDLNRIKDKPLTDKIEGNENDNDFEIGKLSWLTFKKRNDSIIQELLIGQLRSKVTCNKCQSTSTTFDPFLFLPVPIPKARRQLKFSTTGIYNVTVVRDQELPTEFSIKTSIKNPIKGIFTEISKLINIDTESLLLAEIEENKVERIFDVNTTDDLNRIYPRDLYVYQIPSKKKKKKKKEKKSKKKNKKKKKKNKNNNNNYNDSNDSFNYNNYYNNMNSKNTSGHKYIRISHQILVKQGPNYNRTVQSKVVGIPILIPFEKMVIEYSALYDQILSKISNMINLDKIYNFEKNKKIGNNNSNNNNNNENNENYNQYSDFQSESVDSTPSWEGWGGFQSTQNPNNLDREYWEKWGFVKNEFSPFFKIAKTSSFSSYLMKEYKENESIEIDDVSEFHLSLLWNPNLVNEGLVTTQILSATLKDDSVKKLDLENGKNKQQDGISLLSCIKQFVTLENLGKKDMVFCKNCKAHTQAEKKMDVWVLPTILIIHLKRFEYENQMRSKITEFINFPLQIDLAEIVQGGKGNGYVYNLYAVSNHSGVASAGHYTAMCRNKNDKKWYNFNDSWVSQIDDNKIQSSEAYLLFYQRKQIETKKK
ncbi:ubiquitin carboxyl-terminal hydrolase 10-related [Anaeramoeba flamelloides]|uniref:Ubiquitin carboxyl-terminal hydrolase 10-related n=1 Tax=Anaeramoeba flamelloides TaxID=1746091 RepID=A0AAV8AGG6_9EUKA|nr:ubiquitin carboxyl-terminal hydrolase 10-related [Anaeramoeba flamelloides]